MRRVVPVILHLHGSGYDVFFRNLSLRKQAIVKRFFARSWAVVALSAYWKTFLVQEMGLPPEKVVVVPNGAPDPGLITNSERSAIGGATCSFPR